MPLYHPRGITPTSCLASAKGPARSATRGRASGFTLIELLVVIAIIGILSSVVLASLNSARNKGYDAKRVSDLTQLQTALELYYSTNNSYPNPGWAWRSQCPAWGGYTAANVIPGLSPAFIPTMPTDGQMDTANNLCCYLYLSNGTDYKLLAHNCPTSNKCYGSGELNGGFYDPNRPTWACAVYSSQNSANW